MHDVIIHDRGLLGIVPQILKTQVSKFRTASPFSKVALIRRYLITINEFTPALEKMR